MERRTPNRDDVANVEPGAGGANIRVILWNDLFVVVDNGSGRVRDYAVLHELIMQRTRHVTRGLGCLAIIPDKATPPPPEVRAALDRTLQSIQLRCICWCIEGQGFHSAMVRAVLNGLRFVRYQKFPSHIASTLEEALAWMLPHLAGGGARLSELRQAADYVRAQRDMAKYVHTL